MKAISVQHQAAAERGAHWSERDTQRQRLAPLTENKDEGTPVLRINRSRGGQFVLTSKSVWHGLSVSPFLTQAETIDEPGRANREPAEEAANMVGRQRTRLHAIISGQQLNVLRSQLC